MEDLAILLISNTPVEMCFQIVVISLSVADLPTKRVPIPKYGNFDFFLFFFKKMVSQKAFSQDNVFSIQGLGFQGVSVLGLRFYKFRYLFHTTARTP